MKKESKQTIASLPHIKAHTPKQIETTDSKASKIPGLNTLNLDCLSIGSHELFEEGKDDIILEGELMKFKPGLTVNFIPRYVQISKRAFRYFKNEQESYSGKPIVSIRKTIIDSAEPYEVNKWSYLKPGSAVAKSHKEDKLFDNMFEIVLSQDYEDNFTFRKLEMDYRFRKENEQYEKEEKERQTFRSNITKDN